MPIDAQHVDCVSHALHHWTVSDEDAMVDAIAHVLLGRHDHARKILARAAMQPPPYMDRNITEAISRLDLSAFPADDPRVANRDGWLFQMISWLVCVKHGGVSIVAAPHARPAHKGFDGIFVRLAGSAIDAIEISEDKATDNPRDTVLTEVWTEFGVFERGERDNELTSEIIALLDGRGGIDLDQLVRSSSWIENKRYRASVATSREKLPKTISTFEGFQNIITGGIERRSANLFLHDNMRQFFADLSQKIVAKLESLRPATHV